MNFNFYIFGTPQGRYSQYPNDYIATTISAQQTYVEGSRLTIVRKNDLVHYIFTERVDKSSTIGLCLVFNKARINKPKHLTELFQYIIETQMVERGSIIKYNDSGHLNFAVNSIVECSIEHERLQEYVNDELESNSNKYGIEPLKTVFDGTNTTASLDQSASDARIVQLTSTHNTVIVNLDEGIRHGYIEQIIDSLSKSNESLQKENAALKGDIEQLSKQKKQYRTVIILSVILLIGAIVAIASISGKNREIEERNGKIESLESDIDSKNSRISNLQQDYNSLENKYDNVISTYPFEIRDIKIGIVDYNDNIETDYGYTLYDYNTMYLKPKIYYNGFVSGSREIKIKWYTPSGEIKRGTSSPIGYSTSESVYFYTGSNEATLTGWGNSTRGHWSSGTYRIEIWYNNMCLKSKTFTIY